MKRNVTFEEIHLWNQIQLTFRLYVVRFKTNYVYKFNSPMAPWYTEIKPSFFTAEYKPSEREYTLRGKVSSCIGTGIPMIKSL